MKEVKCKLYKFEELSEESQKKVMNRERNNIQSWGIDAWDSEHRNTLEKFANIVGIKIRDWEVSDYNHNYSFCFLSDVYERDADDVKGKYLLRFLNSIYFDIRSQKSYFTGERWENGNYHYSHRKSNILWQENDCPLTGVCYDCDILYPIYEWHKNPDWNKSLYDLVDECLEEFFSAWEKENEYCGSDEYVKQELTESSAYEDVLYFEDGTVFDGIYEEVA
jgi:hypothetical protein